MRPGFLSRAAVLAPVLGLVLSPAAAPAQTAARSDPLSVRVDRVFSEYQRPGSPGCALGVVRDGELVYSRGYGLANVEHEIPITPTTVFDIGSTSKQITAASIALLAQEGRLSLEDDVRRWIPELPDYGPTITLRHLLNHTSGLRDYLTLMSLAGVHFDGVTTGRDALDLITRQRELNFAPGEQYLYSNSGYFLLGEVVKRASGTSLREFARRKIFEPLGMGDTHFHDDHTEVVPRRATGYARDKDRLRVAMSGFEQVGDGAVYTTVEDLALWDRNFYEPRVGGRTLLESLHTRGLLNGGDTLTYALGLMVAPYRGLPTVSHGGSWAGYRAELLRFPEERFSAIVLCNVADSNPSALARRVAEEYLGDRMQPAESAGARQPASRPRPEAGAHVLAPAEQRAFAARYASDEIGVDYTIALQGPGLVLRRPGAEDQPLAAVAPDEFTAGGLRLRFERDGAGAVTGFVLDAGRTRNLRFRRLP